MATIANWGSQITFNVNSKKILTFKNFKRNTSARWTQHNIVGKKPKSEFVGMGADSVTLDITLSAEHGVKPLSVINKLESACKNGETEYLYIGGTKVGTNKMYIESISESWNEIWNKGELTRATVSLTFTEYR